MRFESMADSNCMDVLVAADNFDTIGLQTSTLRSLEVTL
jgi:hypothetical protein